MVNTDHCTPWSYTYSYIHGQHRSMPIMVLHLQLHSWSTRVIAHHGPTLTITFMVNTGHCTSQSYTYNYIHGQHGSLHITVLHLQLHSWSTWVIAHHSPTLTITFMVNTGHCTLQSYSVPPTFTVNTNHCTSWSYSKQSGHGTNPAYMSGHSESDTESGES